MRKHTGGTGSQPQRRNGIGFYSYNQIRNTTHVGRIAGILVGALYASWGTSMLREVISAREAEVLAFGAARPHIGILVEALSLFAISMFVAHVGVIFYWRKFSDFVRGRIKRHEG